ncbi:MAG: type II toxin-antitoxin system RelE/ParE family toxin [Pseudolabrys sp.]
MRVRYTRRGQADLDAIFTYLDAQAPATAQSVKITIERRIALLGEFPFIAPATDEPGVYELTIIRFPYKVYYEVGGGEVRVVHIRDARRRSWIKSEE